MSYDSPTALKQFKDKFNIPFTFLSDSEKNTGKAYGVHRILFTSRKTFLIEKDGTIGKIFNKVDLHSHPDDVLQFFDTEVEK